MSFLGVKESRYRKSNSNSWKGLAQGLFKYQIGFAVALAVPEIWLDEETTLLGDFWRFLAYLTLTSILRVKESR